MHKKLASLSRIYSERCEKCHKQGIIQSWKRNRRLYVRDPDTKAYKPVGWICDQAHVKLDKKQEAPPDER